MSIPLFDLTSFQRDLLYVIVGLKRPSGQQVKTELESDEVVITHGRLYPNLETLVEEGYLEKGQVDKRTNAYELSEKGKRALTARREWEDRYAEP